MQQEVRFLCTGLDVSEEQNAAKQFITYDLLPIDLTGNLCPRVLCHETNFARRVAHLTGRETHIQVHRLTMAWLSAVLLHHETLVESPAAPIRAKSVP